VKKLEEETKSLRDQLAAVQEKLKTDKAKKPCTPDEEFSVLSVFSKTGSIALGVSEHLLQLTTFDEKVVAAVASAKVHVSNVKSQIASVDYKGYVNNVKTHPAYLTHIAPHVSTVSTLLAPHMETAQLHLNPLFKAAQTHYATAAAALEKDVFPALRQRSSQAYSAVSESPQHLSHLNAKLGEVLDPVFKATATAAPKQSSFLPKQPVDRLLLLLTIVLFLYIFAKIAVKTGALVAKVILLLLRVALWIPIKLSLRIVGFSFFLATGFYCCGLCRRKKAPVEKTNKAEAKKAEKVDAKKGAEASVAEVTKILEDSKQEGSLPARAKKLAAVAKSGKPSNGIKSIEGKEVSKETLKKALSKFKEVNVKELGL